MTTCKEAVIDAMVKLTQATCDEVENFINHKYPDKPWKSETIKLHLVGLSDHPSGKHHPHLQKQACLHYLGHNKYELKKTDSVEISSFQQESTVTSSDLLEATISLERDLQEYLLRDLSCVEKGLKVYSHNGISGKEYSTEVGRIDILAQDSNEDYVVIELKAGTANHSVIGQVLGYISCIRKTLAEGKNVRGIIIADDFDKRVKYAIEELKILSLKRYKVTFHITDAI
jgi:endonuclease